MTLRSLSFAALWLAIASCESPTARGSSEPGRAVADEPLAIAWTTYEDAVARAGTEQKPVVLVFTATWCSQCRAYQQVLDDPEVIAMSRRFLMVRIDIDERRDLNASYDVDGRYVPRT